MVRAYAGPVGCGVFLGLGAREVACEGPYDRLDGRLIRSCDPDGGQLGRQVQEGVRH